jgi:hypothetical protein
VTRFRIRIRNSNLLANTNQAGAISLNGIAIGKPNTGAENAWLGDFTVAPTQVVAAGTIDPGDTGAEYVSPWIYPTTFNLVPNTFYGLSIGFTCPGVQVNSSSTPGWSWVGTGSAASFLNAAAPGTNPQPYIQMLDTRMDYEFQGSNEIGMVVGTSIDSGWLTTVVASVATGHMGPDNCWLQQAALRLAHHAMNGGVGGATAAANASSGNAATFGLVTNLSWTRFFSPESGYTAFACTPDYLIVNLGVNDGYAITTITLAQFQAAIRAVAAIAVSLGIGRLYIGTAGTGFTISLGNVANQAGQASANPANPITSISIANVLGPGPNTGQPGAGSAWYNAAGGPYQLYLGDPQNLLGGPYTVSAVTSGGTGATLVLAISGAPARPANSRIGMPVLTASEYNRQNFNLWIRSLPPPFQSVLDFEIDSKSPFYYPSAVGRPEYYANTGDVHPTNIGLYDAMASRFVNGLVGN